MATLKEHQAAMVDLLANGSGIPASASRLAHAMHDVLAALHGDPDLITMAIRESKGLSNLDATTPGLNDKALSKPQKALKTDSPAKWPTPAEQRVKELENTIKQLKGRVAELKQERDHLAKCYDGMQNNMIAAYEREQAGCRKDDTQVCNHSGSATYYGKVLSCDKCGEDISGPTEVCKHEWSNSSYTAAYCVKCGDIKL